MNSYNTCSNAYDYRINTYDSYSNACDYHSHFYDIFVRFIITVIFAPILAIFMLILTQFLASIFTQMLAIITSILMIFSLVLWLHMIINRNIFRINSCKQFRNSSSDLFWNSYNFFCSILTIALHATILIIIFAAILTIFCDNSYKKNFFYMNLAIFNELKF